MRLKSSINLAVSVISTAVLVACGGGGGGSTPAPYPTPAPTPAPTPEPTPEPTPAPLTASLLSVTVDGSAYDVIQMSGAVSYTHLRAHET